MIVFTASVAAFAGWLLGALLVLGAEAWHIQPLFCILVKEQQ